MHPLVTPRVLAVFVFMSCGALSAGAASTVSPKSTANKPPSSVRFIDAPSSESAAARRARLKRECKGRPNAGACLGLTGPD